MFRRRRAPATRVRLGSPEFPVSQPGRYLRHRASALRAYEAQRRARRTRRLLTLLGAGALYFAIGRDVINAQYAKLRTFSSETRLDIRSIARNFDKSLKARELTGGGKLRPEQFTSAAAAKDLHLDEDEAN
jgi:hypothetical protein